VTSGPPILSGSSATLREGRGQTVNLDTGSPPPLPLAKGTLFSPGCSPVLLHWLELSWRQRDPRSDPSIPTWEAPSEMVSAGHRKGTERFGG
jgi:hypothetical protein